MMPDSSASSALELSLFALSKSCVSSIGSELKMADEDR